MASRVRQSTAGPTQRRPGNELPAYEKPTFSLNPTAQRALAQLSHTHKLNSLDASLVRAQAQLSSAAADINERLTDKTRLIEKRKKEQNSSDAENGANAALEQSLEEFRDRVERMTQRMEQSMRKAIDGRHNVQSLRTSLDGAADYVRANASTQASTQPIRSQRTRRRVRDDTDEDGSEDDSDEYQDFEPTNPAASTQPQTSAIETFRSKLDDAKARYQSHSLTERYANNNEYREFRRYIHDAQHPDGDEQLAHHTEWFREQEPPPPGVTTRARKAADDDEDDEDDIAVSRATISTRCPLTLQELKNPLTSRKCLHSFEREAILSMINTSTQRMRDRPNAERIVRCPVTGCDQALTRADLYADNVLIRKIQRIQRARELEDEDAEESDGQEGGGVGHPISVEGDGMVIDDIVDSPVVPQRQTQRKLEDIAASARPIGDTAVDDRGGDMDSDEEDADDGTDEDTMEE